MAIQYALFFTSNLCLLAMGTCDSTWHSAKLGEIFETDGVLTRKRYYMDAWGLFQVDIFFLTDAHLILVELSGGVLRGNKFIRKTGM